MVRVRFGNKMPAGASRADMSSHGTLGSASCAQHCVGLSGVCRSILGAWLQRAVGAPPAWAVKGRGHTGWKRRLTLGSGAPCFSGTQPCRFQLCFDSCPNPASVSPLARRAPAPLKGVLQVEPFTQTLGCSSPQYTIKMAVVAMGKSTASHL